jgi:hypothetical protein
MKILYTLIILFSLVTISKSQCELSELPNGAEIINSDFIREIMEDILHYANQDELNTIRVYNIPIGNAYVLTDYNEMGNLIDMIFINYNKYDNICIDNNFTLEETKALFTWILGHEFNHLNKKHGYKQQISRTEKLYQELQCDKWGGALLAHSTDVGLDFLKNKLIRALNEGNDNRGEFSTYPRKEYRKLGVMGGWLREKIRGDNSDTIIINDIRYIRYKIGTNYKVVEEGKKERFGIHIYSSEAFYYGFYNRNKSPQRGGNGILEIHQRNSIKYIYMGLWYKDNKQKGIQCRKNNYYEGEFLNNLKNGKGILIVLDEYRYEGLFKNDKKHGIGEEEDYERKLIYHGKWSKGKKNGKGIEVNKENNTLMIGIWKKDRFKGSTYTIKKID